MFSRIKRITSDVGISFAAIVFGLIMIGFIIMQIKTCVTCDGVVMKTIWDTYVCVDESAIKD